MMVKKEIFKGLDELDPKTKEFIIQSLLSNQARGHLTGLSKRGKTYTVGNLHIQLEEGEATWLCQQAALLQKFINNRGIRRR